MDTTFRGRGRASGEVVAEALVALEPFGFWQGIDPTTGEIINRRHPLVGESVAGKVFVFSYGRGSTGNPGVFLEAVRNEVAPAALVCLDAEPGVTICAILAQQFYGVQIPVVDGLSSDFYDVVQTGVTLRVSGDEDIVEIV